GDPGLLEADPVGARPAADGDEDEVHLEVLTPLEVDDGPLLLGLDRGDPRRGAGDDPALPELAGQVRGDRRLLARDDPVEGLDDRHLGAEAAQHRGELDADDTAPEDGRAPRDLTEV